MRARLEIAVEGDPTSLLDRSDIVQSVGELKARLGPWQWALLELVSLEVARVASMDLETRRTLLHLPHLNTR